MTEQDSASTGSGSNMDHSDITTEHAITWELVSGRKRHILSARDPRKAIKVSDTITTKNRFESLTNVNDDSQAINKPPVNAKPPPIHLNDVQDYTALVSFLHNEGGPNSFRLKTTTRGVSVYPENADVYRRFVTSLRRGGADFHTYQLLEDKCPRVVIKNLHYATPVATIKQELANYGYEATNVSNVISRFKTPLPMFFVDVSKATFNEKIFDIDSLYYTRVKIEEPRKKRMIPQCVRCQQYGHTKTYCNHPPKCVRCGLGHESKTCTKTRETAATCANCDGAHPANYRGCETLKELRKNRNRNYMLQRTPKVQPPPPSLNEFPSLPQPQQLQIPHPSPELQQQKQMQQPVPAVHQQPRHTGMGKNITQQPSPTEASGQILNLITGLNNLIQPLFGLLQQLSQVTLALSQTYGP